MTDVTMPPPPRTYERWDVIYELGGELKVLPGVEAVSPAIPRSLPDGASEVGRVLRQPDPFAVVSVGFSVLTQPRHSGVDAAPDEPMGNTRDNAEESQIANRLRTLAQDHGQRAVYMLSYDADFLHEVADRIWPPHRSIGTITGADCWCAIGKDHSWDVCAGEAEGVQR